MAVPNEQPSCSEKKEEEFQREEITLLHQLLPELWPEILQHLSSSDFLSLINFSSQLRESEGLKPETTRKLISLVLPILISNQRDISAQTILNMRQLSQVAKKAIGDMLEEAYSPQNYWEKITTPHVVWTVIHQNLKGICERKGGVTDEGMLTQNPFLGRYFQLDFNTFQPDNQGMIEQFLNYMTEHGHNVAQLVCNRVKNIRYVFSILRLVPNLRVLKVHSVEDVQDAEQFVRPVHYPPLPHLELLDVDFNGSRSWICEADTRLITAFVRHYGTQLKWINCNDQFFKGWWRFINWYTPRLQKLKGLRVTDVDVGGYVFAVLNQIDLPNLQVIQLHQVAYMNGNACCFQVVLAVMDKFGATLSSFHLYATIGRLSAEKVEQIGERIMSPLPKLTRFDTCLSNVHSSWFWLFIERKCWNLEELSFEEDRKASEEVQVLTMIQSKAFKLAPKLKWVRITYVVRVRNHREEKRPPLRIQFARNKQEWKRLSINEK